MFAVLCFFLFISPLFAFRNNLIQINQRSTFLSMSKLVLPEYQTKLVEDSWAAVSLLGCKTVGIILFKNLFAVAPESMKLFKGFRDDPNWESNTKFRSHAADVVNTVGVAVAGLRDADGLIPVLKKLGGNHFGYGVNSEHYDVLAGVLITTLKAGLGDAFTDEVQEAWTTTYATISTVMQQGKT